MNFKKHKNQIVIEHESTVFYDITIYFHFKNRSLQYFRVLFSNP